MCMLLVMMMIAVMIAAVHVAAFGQQNESVTRDNRIAAIRVRVLMMRFAIWHCGLFIGARRAWRRLTHFIVARTTRIGIATVS